MTAPTYRFEVYADKSGAYRWRLVASNGRTIAASGESFSSKRKASYAARNVGARAAGAKLVSQA